MPSPPAPSSATARRSRSSAGNGDEGSPTVRTLYFGIRVADLERSLAFYRAVGYEVVGSVPETAIGHLIMLKLPDDEFVTIELVHDPTAAVERVTDFSHF